MMVTKDSRDQSLEPPTRAVLTVPCGVAGGAGQCLPLFPLLDRPFLQHLVEYLTDRGVREFHFVLGRHADEVEELLGDGARWGVSFYYHLTRDPDRPGRVLRAVAARGGLLVVGHADRLPELPRVLPARRALFDAPAGWTGWAVVGPDDVTDGLDRRADLEGRLADRGADRIRRGPPLRFESLADVGPAQQALLLGEFPGVYRAAREVRSGVWLARNVRVAAAAELVPPVFVGENTVVGAGARVGPYAVVGPNCLLDTDCGVQQTTVLPGSYVGPGVELDGVIVDRDRLINPRTRTAVAVDRHLLGGLTSPSLAGGARVLAERVAALTLFVLALPVLLAAVGWLRLTRSGPVFWPRRFVQAPASSRGWRVRTVHTLASPRPGEREVGWVIPPTARGVVLELLPALLAVARGHLRLTGLPPRDAPLVRQLQAERRPALLGFPSGLVTEASLHAHLELTPEDVLLIDAFQAYSASPAADLLRLARFFTRTLTGRWKADPDLLPAESIPPTQYAAS